MCRVSSCYTICAYIFYIAVLLMLKIDLHCAAKTCFHFGSSASEVITHVKTVPNDAILNHISRVTRSISEFRVNVFYDESIKHKVQYPFMKEKVVHPAVTFWQKTLRLKSRSNFTTLRLDRSCVGGATSFQMLNTDILSFCANGCRSSTRCGPIKVPPDHLNECRLIDNGNYKKSGNVGAGMENTDFVLYISSLNTIRCRQQPILAYASHCQLEAHTDRPIAGYINFCPTQLSGDAGELLRSLFMAKHELAHALGFSTSLFAMYRDQNGRPLTPRNSITQLPALGWFNGNISGIYQWSDKIVRKVTRSWMGALGNFSKDAYLVVTPTVLHVARAYFDCPALDGVELEDQDEDGVFLTHWEKRLLENELMTATYTNSYRVSPITLAMMEDTGWYIADYSMAHDFSWGRGRGCLFATASCLEYMLDQQRRGQSLSPFCAQVQPMSSESERLGTQVSCTPDGNSYGFCNLVQHTSPLPPEYVYFETNETVASSSTPKSVALATHPPGAVPLRRLGGKIALANYCPYYQEITWESKEGKAMLTTHCHEPLNTKDDESNWKLESFGPKAVCVEHAPNWRLSNAYGVFALPVEGAGCYSFRCSRLEGGLVLTLAGGLALPCTWPQRLLHVSACLIAPHLTVDGSLVCPDCRRLCEPSQCPYVSNGEINISTAVLSLRGASSHAASRLPFFGLRDRNFSWLNKRSQRSLTSYKQSITPGVCTAPNHTIKLRCNFILVLISFYYLLERLILALQL